MRTVAVLLFMLLAGGLAAQTPTVRSGDHATFTRLTIDAPVPLEWVVRRGARSFTLTTDDAYDRLNLSRLFTRITRDRIAAVREVPGGLDVSLACPCDIRQFQTRSGLFVIDILDRAAPERRSVQTMLDVAGRSAPYRFGASVPFEAGGSTRSAHFLPPDAIGALRRETTGPAQAFNPLGRPPARTPSSPERAPDTAEPAPPVTAATPPAPPASAIRAPLNLDSLLFADRVSALEQSLTSSIEQAGDVGLLDLRPMPSQPEVETAGDEPRVRRSAQEIGAAIELPLQGGGLPISVRGASCPAQQLFSVSGWVSGGSFDGVVSARRAQLYDGAGQLDPSAALSLAQAYVYFAFGFEAAQVLALLPERTAEADLLLSMAEVIEDRSFGSQTRFADLESCAPSALLWSVLETRQDLFRAAVDTETIIRSYLELSPPLKAHFRDLLESWFDRRGDPVSADAIASIAERQDPSQRADAKLGATDGAGFDIWLPTDADDRSAADTAIGEAEIAQLISSVETAWQQKAALDPRIASVVDSFRLQHRDSSFAAALTRAYVRALALSQQFDLLEGHILQNGITDEDLDAVVAYSADQADDMAFLRFLFALDDRVLTSASDDTLGAVNERLRELGFEPELRTLVAEPERSEASAGPDRAPPRPQAAPNAAEEDGSQAGQVPEDTAALDDAARAGAEAVPDLERPTTLQAARDLLSDSAQSRDRLRAQLGLEP